MSETRVRDKQVKVYVTERERDALKRRARRARMTVGAYARHALIHSNDLTVVQIDTAPFEGALHELRKIGGNLNQIARHLNTYGMGPGGEIVVRRAFGGLESAYMTVTQALISLRKEAGRHKVVIDLEPDYTDDDNEG